jgi:hypothetical protein
MKSFKEFISSEYKPKKRSYKSLKEVSNKYDRDVLLIETVDLLKLFNERLPEFIEITVKDKANTAIMSFNER